MVDQFQLLLMLAIGHFIKMVFFHNVELLLTTVYFSLATLEISGKLKTVGELAGEKMDLLD
jgi:hypothetical protein